MSIISAMKFETSELANYYKNNSNINFFYTGIGKIKTLQSLQDFPQKLYNYPIIFTGFAGALKAEFKFGDVLEVNKSQIISVDRVADKIYKNKLSQTTDCDLVDMESQYVFEFFEAQNAKIKVIKVVSDELSQEPKFDKQVLKLARKKLTEYLINDIYHR